MSFGAFAQGQSASSRWLAWVSPVHMWQLAPISLVAAMKCGARRTTQVQVRKVTVQTTEVPLSDLKVPEATVQELQSVEASMRVDAVASAGFRMSRSKMLAAVKNGDVRVNWLPCSKPSREVEAGDLIACAGKVSFQMLLECLQSDAC